MKKVFSNFIDFKKITSLLVLFSVVILMTSLASCKKDKEEKEQTFKGPEIKMGNGNANSFFKISSSGIPIELGIELTTSALIGLSETVRESFNLPFDQKVLNLTPFDHLVTNWHPLGHAPVGIHTVPHFDFYFYKITLAEQLAIPVYSPASAAQFDLFPPPGFIPASYVPNADRRPGIGLGWRDPAEPSPFKHTMVYGSYNGQVNFVQPKVTLAVLQAGTTVNTPYQQPQKFAKAGKWYPTKYNIYMDQQTLKHYVTLSDFVKR